MLPTESRLVQMAKAGDTESFEKLIENSKQRAYNIAFRYLRNEEDALDALQESMIKVYRNIQKFHEESQFDTWVYRIVINTCNDMLRKSSKWKHVEPIEDVRQETIVTKHADQSELPEQAMEQQEQRRTILYCLERLPRDQKEILILRDIQGFTYEEIAILLKCSVGTVKSRISRARTGFREHWNNNLKYSSKK